MNRKIIKFIKSVEILEFSGYWLKSRDFSKLYVLLEFKEVLDII